MSWDDYDYSTGEHRDPLERAGIPVEFWDKTFEDLDPCNDLPGFDSVVAAVKQFVEKLKQNLENGTGLVLCGTVGTGKTLLLSRVAVEAVRLLGPEEVLQVEAHTFFDSLKPNAENERKERRVGYKATIKEPKARDRYRKVRLLVIDDVGAEYHTDWAQVELDGVITSRHNNQLTTCITTNLLNAQEFEDTYGARIADRLLERNCWYTLDGPSFRKPASQEAI